MAKKKNPESKIEDLYGLVNKWNETARDWLLGRKIVEVHYLTKAECLELGVFASGIRFTLDNGVECDVMRDDEGNGPGALHVFNPKDGSKDILCVVSLP